MKSKIEFKEKVLADMYDFAKDRLVEYGKEMPLSEKQRGIKTGRLDVLAQLLHFIKHYEE